MIGLITQPRVGVRLNTAHPLARGLVGYWMMNEGSGIRANDLSGNGNHGTLTNMVQGATSGWTGGKFGGAMNFDGVDDVVTVANGFTLNELTVSLWFMARTIPADGIIITSGNYDVPTSWGLDLRTNLFFWYLDDDGDWGPDINISAGAKPLAGIWYHATMTYSQSSGIVKTYLNSSFVTSASFSGSLWATTILRIGFGLAAPFPGSISEVRIYNRALSASEVQMLYANPHIDLLYPAAQKHFRMA